jgi:dihydrofolate reductase
MAGLRVSLIVAVADNGVIGDTGAMPWKLPSDLKYFKQKTLHKPVLMGRKTFEAIGRPLPGRDNIVVTRNETFEHDGVFTASSVAVGLELAQRLATKSGADEIMVIGGGEIYAQTLAAADRIYKTEVQADVVGDTIFPKLDSGHWREVSRQPHKQQEGDSSNITFVIFERWLNSPAPSRP